MSGGKGSSTQTTQVKLPPFLEKAATENISLADDVGRLGFMPNLGPTVAGFSPGQRAAMDNTNQAARAFGMTPAGSVDDYMMGESFNGGAAYGGAPVYEQMLAGLTPEQRASIMSFISSDVGGTYTRPQPAQPAQQGGGKGAMGSLSSNSGGGMWSDGMTGRQIEAERSAGTFGSGMPSSQRGQSFGSPASAGSVNSGGLY